MKLKRGRVYRSLFISDVHYLLDKKVKPHHHKELFSLLDYFHRKKIRFERIFLVGDILENWYLSSQRKLRRGKGIKRFNKLFDRLDQIAIRRAQKIYIIGNHDSFNYTLTLPPQVETYLENRGWETMEIYEDNEIVVAHGHQGQYGKIFWFINILIVKIVYSLALLSPSFFHAAEEFYRKNFNFDRNETREEMLQYYSILSNRVRQKNRLLISGHTHQFLASEDLYVINTGDWVESRTFVIQDGDIFYGYVYKKKNIFEREFKLKLRKNSTTR
ncbi:MAG: metallophosphoesterase family protein [Leptospiraceae bacterium]|nr:metallophosphoesterase family protein [Leptospiraceae bacterium]MDW8306602.1 metallophosphoesterase family protein [Leptospiraceae bacterium]